MKKINICSLFYCLLVIFIAGCSNIPEHNYMGMTKAEVAAYLEKHAFRDRWSGNRFEIEVLQKQMSSRLYGNSQEVTLDEFMMSANKWRCGFFPQRHWLPGWNGIFSRWHCVELIFKDGRVAGQKNLRNCCRGRGEVGKSPYPNYPPNFHKVNENIFRSGQPDEDEFESLCTFNGIRSVLNLRDCNSDKKIIGSINKRLYTPAVTLYDVPIATGKISEADLYKILTVFRDASKPLLVHCWQGSNRTGCAVAAYRIVFENWSVEEAIAELMKPEYGHFSFFYSNIPELLRKADWQKIKTHFTRKQYKKK